MARAAQQREQADRAGGGGAPGSRAHQPTSSLTVALKAMQEAAAKDLASADAQMMQGEAAEAYAARSRTTPTSPPQWTTAAGKPPAPQSLGERLAVLKTR